MRVITIETELITIPATANDFHLYTLFLICKYPIMEHISPGTAKKKDKANPTIERILKGISLSAFAPQFIQTTEPSDISFPQFLQYINILL